MSRRAPLLILAVSIAAGMAFIAYNIYLLYVVKYPAAALKTRFAYFGVGVVLILSGWYIYVLLGRVEQLKTDQDEPQTDYLVQQQELEQLRTDQERLRADYMALQQEKERLQSDISRLQREKEQQELSQSGFPKICDIENDNILPPLGSEEFDIMQHLFQNHYRICVKRIRGGYSNSGVYHVIPETTEGKLLKPGMVVKYLTFQDILKEKNAYQTVLDRYPLPHTPGRPTGNWPPDDQLSDSRRIGAVSYELAMLNPDGQLQSLTDLYKQQPFEEFVTYLELLFKRLDRWYAWRQPKPGDSSLGGPDGIYERLYRKRDDIQDGISQLIRSSNASVPSSPSLDDLVTRQTIELPFLPEALESHEVHNPIYWIDHVFVQDEAECFKVVSPYSPVHGDLHTGNVLVEKGRDTHIWLIDFPNAHVGPALQDFATMEADVKFNLIDMEQCSLDDWLTFEQRLLLPLRSGFYTLDWPWSQDWQPEREELLKAWLVIGFLRRWARERRLIGDDVCSYYLALLHDTLPFVYRQTRTKSQKQAALISSAWMCEYLGS